MLVERIENRWLAAFTRTFTLCKVQPGEVVAILAETQSRRVNVDLASFIGSRKARNHGVTTN